MDAEAYVQQLEQAVHPNCPAETRGEMPCQARLQALTKLLVVYAVGARSELEYAAKFELYEDSLYDLPFWVCDAAIKKWNRGEVWIPGANCSYPPSPAVLRQMANIELQPYLEATAALKRLLSVVTLEEAMDPRRIQTKKP